ncbi:MAG: ATP-binding cassette domain-containing protein, partial [Saprospiraceae bacterium]
PSGIGKSTLLETLGLMNNTISNPETSTLHFITSDGQQLEISKIWSSSDKELATLRSKHFSFIFQENNLMPGLTAGQNLCTKLLIQGKTMAEARQVALPFMSRLDLPEELFDRNVFELSGGQRQRLAFLRAFLGEYHVLFGDEPTGNLDEQTALKLMNMLCESIKTQQNTSAIIVSHDLTMATRFADMIIPIIPKVNEENPEKKSGLIDMAYVILRSGENWMVKDNFKIENLEEHLRQLLSGKAQHSAS